MPKKRSNRREFLKTSALGVITGGLTRSLQGQDWVVPMRPFGKTGEKISALGLGGWHAPVSKTALEKLFGGQAVDNLFKSEDESVDFIRQAIDHGVTFLDNAWEYHDGRAEEIMGLALQDGYRKKSFLMTKHHGRDKQTALRQLEESLKRLKTDVIDLWQFHEIIYEKDAEMIFASGGGIEAAEQAKKDGKVRFIGFTGHKDPRFFKKMLDMDYPWDAVQMPLGVLDTHFRSFEKEIIPICQDRGIGILAMKTMGGSFLKRAGVVTPREAIRFVLNLPVSSVISGMDSMEVLRENVETAATFQPLDLAEVSRIREKSREAAMTGQYEPFKSTEMFDSSHGKRLHGKI